MAVHDISFSQVDASGTYTFTGAIVYDDVTHQVTSIEWTFNTWPFDWRLTVESPFGGGVFTLRGKRTGSISGANKIPVGVTIDNLNFGFSRAA